MKIDWIRSALIAGMLVTAFLLVIRWNDFREQESVPQPASEQTLPSDSHATPSTPSVENSANVATDSDVPTLPAEQAEDSTTDVQPDSAGSQLIHVQTDVLDVLIDTHGGDIVKVALPQHYAHLNTPDQPFILLNRSQAQYYVAQSGLIGPDGTDSQGERPVFRSNQSQYRLQQNEEQVTVDLRYSQDSADITKRFIFDRGSNLIRIQYLVNNRGEKTWAGHIYGQIERDDHVPPNNMGIGMQPYVGAALTTPEEKYRKIEFEDLQELPGNRAITVTQEGGWVAMVQHYFVSAWVPEQASTNRYSLRESTRGNTFLLGYTGERVRIQPGQSGTIQTAFYAGPKHIRTLEEIAPYLDLTVDYGWLWWIAKPLFYTLDFMHNLVGNWGLAIILVTVLIKLLFFYPSAMSYRSMAKMRLVQPQMMELKERFGDDRQRMSAELMKLYKKEKVNPLGGCLPVLLQMPVFIALYWVLMESVELRHAPFFLWIQDLSVKDPYFILPLVMGATMWIQQKLNPKPADPTQAKVMQMMPIFFTFLFMVFPAGLVLYWVVNNTLSITQQYIITRQIEREGTAKS